MRINHNNFLKIAFNIARNNLGKTDSNPSVGCVVVKNNSVISTGITSLNGRPHAEFNALNKKKNFKDSDLYTTLEPCTHKGKTPPCTNIIKKKKIKRVFFSFNDVDKRTAKKSNKILKKNKILLIRKKIRKFKDFYESYLTNKNKLIPYVDAKIALSKDFFTINKKKRWITNNLSRNRAHLIRSEYDLIISTSKTINRDNALLNCRLNGFDNNKPDLLIIDLKLKIKNDLKLFKTNKKRKIFIVTSNSKTNKISFLKKKGVRFIQCSSLDKRSDFEILLKKIKKMGYNRILLESGLIFLKSMINYKIISNLFMFISNNKLNKNGINNCEIKFLKKLKLSRRIPVNLDGEKLFKIKVQ